MKPRIVGLALLLCGVAAAQSIYVSPWPVNPWPSCGAYPRQFQIVFNFYVDTYDCNGTLVQDTTFPMTGTGYCSGYGANCSDGSGFAPVPGANWTGGSTGNGNATWYVVGTMSNITAGGPILTGPYGCGNPTSTAAGPFKYVVGSCPSKCSTPHNYPNCVVGCPCGGSPIVIDATGEGFHLTGPDNGVFFRERGDSPAVRFAWTDPAFHNGWLALPKNGNVQSLADLFGNFTPQPTSDSSNGYRALAYFAEQQGCGSASKPLTYVGADNCPAAWNQLRLWIDTNHDGVSQPEELHTLASMGIKRISLHYEESRRIDGFGNEFFYVAKIADEAGVRDNRCYDVFLREGLPIGTSGAAQ